MNHSAQEIQDWIREKLSQLIGVEPNELDPQEPIRRYGLDSVALVAFSTDLEEWLGYQFRSNPLDDHPTIAALAAFLAAETTKGDRETGRQGDRER